MKTFAGVALVVGLAPSAQAADAGIAKVLEAFEADLNKGDITGAKALHARPRP